MLLILSEIVFCLIGAALIGFATGWLLRQLSDRARFARAEVDWRGRAEDLEARLTVAAESSREQRERAEALASRLESASEALRSREREFERVESELKAVRAERERLATGEEATVAHGSSELEKALVALAAAVAERQVGDEPAPGADVSDGASDPQVLAAADADRARKSIGTLFALPESVPDSGQRIAELMAELEGLRHDLASQEDSARWLSARVDQMTPIVGELRDRASVLFDSGREREFARERDRLERELESANAAGKEGSAEVETIRLELEEIRALVDQREETLSGLEDDHAAAASDSGPVGRMLELEREATRLARAVDDRDEQAERLEALRREREVVRSSLAEDARRLAEERESLIDKLRERDDYIDALEVDLQSSSRGQNAEIESLKRRLSELEIRGMVAPGNGHDKTAEVSLEPVPPLLVTTPASNDEGEQSRPNVAEAPAEATPRVDYDGADDLKLIRGIGPVLERTLNGLGVRTFRQIARWTHDDVASVERHLASFRKRVERDNWIDGARQQHWLKYGEWP